MPCSVYKGEQFVYFVIGYSLKFWRPFYLLFDHKLFPIVLLIVIVICDKIRMVGTLKINNNNNLGYL